MVKTFWCYVYSFWHNPRTWQTHTQTHTHTAWRHRPRFCIASRGKNDLFNFPCPFTFTYYITGWPVHSAATPVLFLFSSQKAGFRAKFHVYRGRNVAIQPPKLSKFRILAINLYLRGDSCALFYEIHSVWRVYRQLLSFLFGRFRGTNNKVISIFTQWEHFPTNVQQPLAAKLLIGSKKLGGCKNGRDLLYHHSKYGGRGSRAGCRPKSLMFFNWRAILIKQICPSVSPSVCLSVRPWRSGIR